ncbi:response regulator [Paenibacillus chungangensis]|uniref:Response regulator n=1 Tax=Paenibacillus chungangensis TaxID=696535 RepID=A0ABW3HR49_9BACL
MNMLLVDDETFVLDFLEEHIDRSAFGIQQIIKATSVNEALASLNEHRIALVITDIRMPEQTGLQLLAIIRAQWPAVKVILLSGYSEFEYAQQAIAHGAFAYLLKPALPEEVNRTIKLAYERIRLEEENRSQLSLAEHAIRTNHLARKERLLFDLLMGRRYSTQSIQDQLNELQLPALTSTPIRLLILRLEEMNSAATIEDMELLNYSLANMAEEMLYGDVSNHRSFWYCRDPHQYLCIILEERFYMERVEGSDRLSELQRTVQLYLGRTVSILVSRSQHFSAQLSVLYHDALKSFWQCIGSNTSAIETMDDRSPAPSSQPLKKIYEPPSLLNLMESGQWEELSSKLNDVFEELESTTCRTQEHLMEVYYHICSALSNIAHKQGLRLADLAGNPEYLRNGYFFRTTAQLREWSLSLLFQFQKSIELPSSKRQSHIVQQIHQYVQENLARDVTLRTISEHVFLHPVYLSRLYKKETGETLSTYIQRVRIERAVYLLKHTNMKILEISQAIGFLKPQYFISLFKEHFGVTPQEFREIQSS